MSINLNFDILGPDDRPALLGISNPEILTATESLLIEMGFRVYAAAVHEEFFTRFDQVANEIVILEECFTCESASENSSLMTLQNMPMSLRRHSAVILIGDSFQSLNAMQAFQQSVNSVINPRDIALLLGQTIQKTVTEHQQFISTFREATQRVTKFSAF